jgi:hypothetical protein
MGVGFRHFPHGESSANPPYDLMVGTNATFIRGNHDNPAVCAQHSQWIKDGHVEDGTMFIGGGVSIDRAYRHEGFSWWADEELSAERLGQLVEQYQHIKPKVMVTHDCPEAIAEEMVRVSGREAKLDPRHASRSRQAFHNMWIGHSPDLWIFGHWHHSFDHVLRGTRFVCLAELEHKDFEI